MSATAISINAPDYDAIKSKQQTAWSSGDYGRVGVTLQITGEQLCESMDMRSGQSVLDVAAGNGNVTLATARHQITRALGHRSISRGTLQKRVIKHSGDTESLQFPLQLTRAFHGSVPYLLRASSKNLRGTR